MPYLMVQTNIAVDEATKPALLTNLSARTAEALGKPESYVMVSLKDNVPMVFAGNDAPLAYLELKSIGLPESKTAALSSSLCSAVNEALSIDTNRIYIEFTDAPRAMWGWDSRTF